METLKPKDKLISAQPAAAVAVAAIPLAESSRGMTMAEEAAYVRRLTADTRAPQYGVSDRGIAVYKSERTS